MYYIVADCLNNLKNEMCIKFHTASQNEPNRITNILVTLQENKYKFKDGTFYLTLFGKYY